MRPRRTTTRWSPSPCSVTRPIWGSWPSAPTSGDCVSSRPRSPRPELVPAQSYVSLTEISEYAAGVPEAMRQARLFPQLPPEGKAAFCFYPMSKRRGEEHNWYALELRGAHGAHAGPRQGRAAPSTAGCSRSSPARPGSTTTSGGSRSSACIPTISRTASTRCASTRPRPRYAEFGPFYTGMVGTLDDVLTARGRLSEQPGDRRPREPPRRAAQPRAASSWPSAAEPTRRCWPRWRTTPWAGRRCCAPPRSPRRWPARGARLPGPRRGVGPALGRGADRRDGGRRLRGQRADRCARCKTALMDALGPLAEAEDATVVLGVNVSDLGDHRPGQEAAAAGGCPLPPRRGRLHQGRHPALVPLARPAHLGQAGGGLPGLAPALRHAGDPRPSGRGGAGRGGVAQRSASGSCGFATTATPPASRSRRTRWPKWWRAATRSWRRSATPGSLRRARPRGLPFGQPQPRAGRGRCSGAAGGRGDGERGPGQGQAHVPRVRGPARRARHLGAPLRRRARTSGAPTSRSTVAGSSARSTAREPRSRRRSSGCAARGSPSTCWGTCSRAEPPHRGPAPRGVRASGSRGTCQPAEDTLRGS